MPRVFFAAWCGTAAVLYTLAGFVVYGETLPVSGTEGWAIPFTVGMAGAALTTAWTVLHPARAAGLDRMVWGWLALAASSVLLPMW